MDPHITQFLIGLGGPGVIIAWLLWDRSELRKETGSLRDKLQACQEARLTDVRDTSREVTRALNEAVRVMQEVATGQAQGAHNTRDLAEMIRGLKDMLERMLAAKP
jgi:hypothetical protein